MKILCIAPIPFFHERGACIRTKNIITAMAQLDHKVDILTYPVGQDIEIPNVNIIRVKSPFKPPLEAKMPIKRGVTDLLLYLTALKMVNKTDYSCIVCKTPMGRWIGRKITEKTGIPIIVDVVEDTLGVIRLYSNKKLFSTSFISWLIKLALSNPVIERFFINLEKKNYNSAKVIIANWDLVADRVSKDSGKECVLLYDTIPKLLERPSSFINLRKKHGIKLEDKILLYTGAFSPQQGIDTYLNCIKYLSESDVKMVLVGPVTKNYIKLAEDLGIKSKVIFTGPVPFNEIFSYYSEADVLLTAYDSGGVNATLKLLIYLFQGKPIVASDVPQYRQIVNEKLVFFAKPTPKSFASQINFVLKNKTESNIRALNARAYAEEKFSHKKYMDKIAKILSQIENTG